MALLSRISGLRKRMVRPWTVLPLALVVGGGTWFVSRSDADEADDTTTVEQTVEVTTGAMDQVVSASGTVEAADTDELSFTAAGTVTAVNVAAGDQVSAGDVLATLDSPELEAAVTDAEASVADAEARLDDDQDAGESDAQITADESSLDSAQRQLDAANDDLAGNQLVATIDGTVSAVDLTVGEELGSDGTSGTDMTGSDSGSGDSSSTLGDSDTGAPTGDDSSDSSTSSAQIEVVSNGSYKVQLSIDPTEIEQVAEDQTAKVDVASSSGTTFGGGEIPAGVFPGGGVVPGGDTGSNDDQEGDGQTGDDDADAADQGDGGPAVAPAADEPDATGTVTSVGAIADASSGVADFPVEVTFEGAADTFYVGSSVDVEIVYNQVEDAVQVPVMAVTTGQDGASTVVVETDDGRETRTVETGISSGGYIEVTDGLEAGETVVISITRGQPDSGDEDDDGGGDFQGPAGGFTPPGGGELPAGGGFVPGGNG
jgi:multidrug efflux pump subunit AcrA (membrane-fusion protein)